MAGLFSYNSPEYLFGKLQKELVAFFDNPTADGIYTAIFPLYHLREWICPGGHKRYENKPISDRSREEELHARLHEMTEYQIIRDLCNNAKHFEDAGSDLRKRTEELEGFRCGLGRCGDSLGVHHFLVDEREIRDIFWSVYTIYYHYFNEPNE